MYVVCIHILGYPNADEISTDNNSKFSNSIISLA